MSRKDYTTLLDLPVSQLLTASRQLLEAFADQAPPCVAEALHDLLRRAA
jgi:hypothetical protein